MRCTWADGAATTPRPPCPAARLACAAAWWSYILVADGLNKRISGRSPLLDTPRLFLGLALVSLPWWLLFELLNFRLGNWEYHGVPSALWERRLGECVSFMTVLPGLMETRALAERLLLPGDWRCDGFRIKPGLTRLSLALGAAFLVLPAVWPRWFYPLVWGFAFLLLEPALARRGRSWLYEFSMGRPAPLFSWIAVRVGVADLPYGVNWWQLFAASWLAGIGFTMSLFIASSAFGQPELLALAKTGILVASLLAATVGAVLIAVTTKRQEGSSDLVG